MAIRMKVRKTKSEYNQEIINDYIRETDATTLEMHAVAAWAIKKKRWHPCRKNAIKLCAHELARAARDEYYTDRQGRRVRRKHAVRIPVEGDPSQMTWEWADIETATPDHMKMSLQQRRGYIVGDCKQLKTDLDSYNDNNSHGAFIQISFNFTEDLEELNLPTEYKGIESPTDN